jgi:futalosine hydrolase
MKLLIAAATQYEIPSFTSATENTDVLITGVGIAASLYHLQKRLIQVDYDLVIQAGFAGSFTNGPALGETVLVQKDTFGDLGMEEKGHYQTIFDIGLADKNEFPFTNGWLQNENELLNTLWFKKVAAITVHKLSDDPLLTQQRENTFQPGIETMEGAAFHYVCLQEHIPFLQIRSISNRVGERDKTKWKLKEAVENLDNELTKLIGHLTT